jgi:hypothetical protein
VHLEALEPVDVEFQLRSKLYNCTSNEVWQAMNGSLFVTRQVAREDSRMKTSSGISLETFNEAYMKRTSDQQVEPSVYGPLSYDAVWSFVLALDAAMATIDIGSYSFGKPNMTKVIVEKMLNLSFEGLTGNIHFNESTGHVNQIAQFFLVDGHNVTKVSYYEEESNKFSCYNSSVTEEVFIKDTFDEVIVTLPRQLTCFIVLLLVFAFLLTLTLNVATCAYRKVGSVKASGIKLSQVAFLGCYILALTLFLAVLIYGFTDKISHGTICEIQDVFDISVSVGLTLLLGAICVRIWRLHRIFNCYKDPGRLLSDQYLIVTIMILVLLDVILNIPVFFVDRYQPTRELKFEGGTVRTIITCKRSSSTDFVLWVISSSVISSLLLSTTIILAVLTRKIPQKNFKTKSIMYLSYTLAAVLPLTIGVYLILTPLKGYTNMVLRCCALCSFLLCLILLPCAMLFFPPFIPMLKSKKWKISLCSCIIKGNHDKGGGLINSAPYMV